MATNESLQECGHVALWRTPPELGERIYCHKCQDMKMVLALPGTFYAQCENCRWHIERKKEESVFNNCVIHLKKSSNHSILLKDFQGKVHSVTLRVIESNAQLF